MNGNKGAVDLAQRGGGDGRTEGGGRDALYKRRINKKQKDIKMCVWNKQILNECYCMQYFCVYDIDLKNF